MSILKKTRADLSLSLYFYTPCVNLTDIAFALSLWDSYGHSPRFLEVLDSHRRDFDNYTVVKEIVREYMNGSEEAKEKVEPTPAQAVKAYVENEKVYERLATEGESAEDIAIIRRVQKKFQGRFAA